MMVEKLTIKLCIDGQDVAEIDMGQPRQSSIYEEDIGWSKSLSPQIPCQPYKTKGDGDTVNYYYPYHMMIGINRRMVDEEKKEVKLARSG